MPADDCPSFHCRPSTLSTFLPASLSMRQTPTTGTSDLGSAPVVSPDQSILMGDPTATASTGVARASASRMDTGFSSARGMDRLLVQPERAPRRPAAEPPGEQDQYG